MGPGVPGMGIASIFYATAGLIAPLREVVKSVRGESSAQRWKAVGLQFAIAVGTISSIVLLYVGFDALISRGLLGTPEVTDLPGDFPVWTYAVAAMIVLMLTLALTGGVIALRVRWGSIGEDAEQIALGYRASIPTHEDLQQDGISKGRHRASSPPPVTSLAGVWNHPATTTHLPMVIDERLIRGRHLDEPVRAS